MNFNYVINCPNSNICGSVKLNGKLVFYAGVNLFSAIRINQQQSNNNIWKRCKRTVKMWKNNSILRYPNNVTFSNLMTFIALNKSVNIDYIMIYYKCNNIGIFDAFSNVNNQIYSFSTCMKLNMTQWKLATLNGCLPNTYFVSFYNSFTNTLEIDDPPKDYHGEINIDEILQIKYEKIKSDLMKLKIEEISFGDDDYIVTIMEDIGFRVGLSKKIFNAEKIDKNLISEQVEYDSEKHYIQNGIYIEQLI